MLVTLTQAFDFVKHRKGRSPHSSEKAVGAFNVFGYEDAVAVVEAAESLDEPVALMANKPALEHMPVEVLGAILTNIANRATVPVVVHLDHSTDYAMTLRAILRGFTSVMFDGSQLSFEENVIRTRDVKRAAHACGVSVEAEIGSVGYADGTVAQANYTAPELAVEFEREVEPDALAIAVGTVHRMTTQTVKPDFELMDRIVARMHTPVVIHGSSGLADDDLQRLVQHGAKKINIGTALRLAFGNSLRDEMARRPEEFDRIKLFGPCMKAVTEVVRHKLLLMNGK